MADHPAQIGRQRIEHAPVGCGIAVDAVPHVACPGVLEIRHRRSLAPTCVEGPSLHARGEIWPCGVAVRDHTRSRLRDRCNERVGVAVDPFATSCGVNTPPKQIAVLIAQSKGKVRMILSRRTALVLGLAASLVAGPAFAGEKATYSKPAFEAAQKAGKPILVEIAASWCPTCKAQAPILGELRGQPRFKDLAVSSRNAFPRSRAKRAAPPKTHPARSPSGRPPALFPLPPAAG